MEAMLESALRSAELAEEFGLRARPHHPLRQGLAACRTWCDVYRALAARCDYPLHLGLTEAGMGTKGIVASTAALVDPAAGGDRRHDPRLAHAEAGRRPHRGSAGRAADPAVARLRSFAPQVTACPGCGRTTCTFFQQMAEDIQTLPARADAGVARRATRASRR